MTEREQPHTEHMRRSMPAYDRPFSSFVGLLQSFGHDGALELLASLQEGATVEQALARCGVTPSETNVAKRAGYWARHAFIETALREAGAYDDDVKLNPHVLGAGLVAISKLPDDLESITPILAAATPRTTAVGEIDRNLLILDAAHKRGLRHLVQTASQPLITGIRNLRAKEVLSLPTQIMRGRELRPATFGHYDQAALTEKGEQLVATMQASRNAFHEVQVDEDPGISGF